MIVLFALAFATAVPASPPGTVFPVAPSAPPGAQVPLSTDLLGAALSRRTQGDVPGATWYFEQLSLNSKVDRRTRAAAQVALGVLYLEQGEPGLASVVLAKARSAGTPVAPWATWYQAVAELERGADRSAANLCVSYRESWPSAEHADECLVLIGDAHLAGGRGGAAISAYKAWLDAHPDSPREETLRLRMALATAESQPSAAIPSLVSLALSHSYHSTGLTAEAKLQELQRKGFPAALPATTSVECQVATERRRCGFDADALARYDALAKRAEDDPEIARWVESQEDEFQWSTRQYAAVAANLAEQYQARPDPELAWRRYRAFARGGLWAEAADQLLAGNKAHPTSGRFRTIKLDLARAQLLAGRYGDARETWDQIAKGGGGLGKEARWLAAFSAFRAGGAPDALKRLDAVVAAGGEEAEAARYFRAQALDQLGRKDEAEKQRAEIVAEAPMSWYASLIRSAGSPATGNHWLERAGRWPGPPAATLPELTRVGLNPVPVALPAPGSSRGDNVVDWSLLRWGALTQSGPAAAPILSPAVTSAVPAYDRRPDSYGANFLADPARAYALLDEMGEEYADIFPWAQAAADLGRVGIYRHSSVLVARAFEAWEAGQSRNDSLGARYRAWQPSVAEWRAIFLLVRDDHHATRFSWGATKLASTEEERMQALRSVYPTAHIDAMYRHGAANDIDPLLALGLMRQESVYRQWALSPVGAMGLMQVMPRTGGRVAALMGDPHYSPSDLDDPSVNIRYGVWYLSQLMERFGGAFPLAVASYNGGPHNVSSWLRPWGENIPMDAYVEQIPYTETRDYVKKVTGYYATYVALYGPPEARVAVPPRVLKDDPTVIDF